MEKGRRWGVKADRRLDESHLASCKICRYVLVYCQLGITFKGINWRNFV